MDSFYVPDNFPHKKITGYLPYLEGDLLKFTSGTDTIDFEVVGSEYYYIRGRKNNNDHVKENAAMVARLVQKNIDITITVACLERRRFEVKITQKEYGMVPRTLGVYLYEQETMSDMIFNQFASTIYLTDKKAMIKRDRGILYFTDKDGVKWTSAYM